MTRMRSKSRRELRRRSCVKLRESLPPRRSSNLERWARCLCWQTSALNANHIINYVVVAGRHSLVVVVVVAAGEREGSRGAISQRGARNGACTRAPKLNGRRARCAVHNPCSREPRCCGARWCDAPCTTIPHESPAPAAPVREERDGRRRTSSSDLREGPPTMLANRDD